MRPPELRALHEPCEQCHQRHRDQRRAQNQALEPQLRMGRRLCFDYAVQGGSGGSQTGFQCAQPVGVRFHIAVNATYLRCNVLLPCRQFLLEN